MDGTITVLQGRIVLLHPDIVTVALRIFVSTDSGHRQRRLDACPMDLPEDPEICKVSKDLSKDLEGPRLRTWRKRRGFSWSRMKDWKGLEEGPTWHGVLSLPLDVVKFQFATQFAIYIHI